MYKILIALIFLDWIALRVYFLQLNQILKVPDSFAYLQMAWYFQDLSMSWFWTWWFGFLYSLPIAAVNIFVDDFFFSAQIVNIIFSTFTWFFLYLIWKRYLTEKYNIIFVGLYFISSTILYYNINVLSENIYMFLFIALIYVIHNFLDVIWTKRDIFSLWWNIYKVDNLRELFLYTALISFIMALMYFTRGEAFIYISSIICLLYCIYLQNGISLARFFKVGSLFLLLFFIFISPYIYYLYTITWEWWLTNKWSSNLRQAQMRSIDNMDDIWFEKAVWELTPDNHHLIHWFAGWLKYDKPKYDISLKEYIFDDFSWFISRFWDNQIKLYTRTLPWLIIKDSLKVYWDSNSMVYGNKVVLLIILIPLLLFSYWLYLLLFNNIARLTQKRELLIIISLFFFVASLFFTLFFVLDRYFIIFLPFSFLIMVYWWQELLKGVKSMVVFKYILVMLLLLWSFWLGSLWHYSDNIYKDTDYSLKKEVWEWIYKRYDSSSLQIAERFPIVTYYSWTRERWLVPYTDNVKQLREYLKYNEVDILVVDSKDFKKYRPDLYEIMIDYTKKHNWFELIKAFERPGERVILYKVIWSDLKEKK